MSSNLNRYIFKYRKYKSILNASRDKKWSKYIYSLIHKKMEILFDYPCITSTLTPLDQEAHRHLHDARLATRHLSLRQHKPASPPEEVPQTGSREWYLGQPCCCRASRPPAAHLLVFSSPACEVCCSDAARGGFLWVYIQIERSKPIYHHDLLIK